MPFAVEENNESGGEKKVVVASGRAFQ